MPELLLNRPRPAGVPTTPAQRAGTRTVWRSPGFGGTAGAVLLLCLSLTPSLLPRHWALQGLVSGLSMACGYGAGAGAGAAVRWLLPAVRPVPTRGWMLLAGAGTLTVAAYLRMAETWQREVRQLVELPPQAGQPLLALALAAALCALLVGWGRAVRVVTRRLATTMTQSLRLPRPLAALLAAAVMATCGYALGYGAGFHGFVHLVGQRAAVANAAINADAQPPTSPHVSGGPGSLVDWDSLGAQGRAFVTAAVPVEDLAQFHRRDQVREPVRVYVGHDPATDIAQQAALAVQELERTGAFGRRLLAVVSTTGTGWVNPTVPATLEYLHGGDTAVVAAQYSYLPSWVSFLSEPATAAAAATAVLDAVRQRLDQLPADQRPMLVVYGESLGAFAAEAALGDLSRLAADAEGVLLAGPPHRSPIRQQATDARIAGSPVWQPVHADGNVRFVHDAAALTPGFVDVIYLQHASDPVVWWSPRLLYEPPEWLAGARGPDVSPRMRWFPVVTFWQVTVDLLASTAVPAGHGHSYGLDIVDAWAVLVPPAGWTDHDTARLRARLG